MSFLSILATQRPVDALAGFHGAPGCVVTCEGGPDADAVAQRLGCPVRSLERRVGVRRAWTNESVRETLALLDERDLEPGGKLIPYSSSAASESFAAAAGARLFSCQSALKARLDNKLFMRRVLDGIGVRVPEHVALPASELSFDRIARRFDVPFVVQRLAGSSGLGTWVVREPSDLDPVETDPDETLLASRFAGDAVFNVNAVSLPGRVWLTPPSVQATGATGLGRGEALYCGNDFALARRASPPLLRAIAVHTRRIGGWLCDLGYRGIFGVDFVSDDAGDLRVLEVNTRLQGSTWLAGALGSEPRIGAVHERAFEGDATATSEAGPLSGSFLIVRNPAPVPVGPSRVAPGVYALDADDRLVPRSAGLLPSDCLADDELVVSALPDDGMLVEPNAVLARISSRSSLLVSSVELSALGRRALAALRARLLAPGSVTRV
jgi:hypothetical protein